MNIYPVPNFTDRIYPIDSKHQVMTAFTGRKLLVSPMDTCSFSYSDKTLDPKFLKNLLKIDTENISVMQKYTRIKDELLRAMGYKHPEELKLIPVKPETKNLYAYYEATQGVIYITELNCPITKTIATLRHELEHFDQFLKIYKAMGESAFYGALLNIAKKINQNAKISEVNINFNKNFYERMAKDADINGFDSKKYYDAMCEYTPFSYDLSKAYKYYNNLLEKGAYYAEKRILSSLGETNYVSADQFPVNYKKLVQLLNYNNIPLQYQDNVFNVLRLAAQIKSIETPGNFKKIWKIWINKQNKVELTSKEEEMLLRTFNKVNEIYRGNITLKSVQRDQKCYKQIETWLRQGKCFAIDILNDK